MALKEPFTAKPNNGEAQPTPFYRRRSVQAGGGALLALLTAGGLFAGLKPSHNTDKAPQPHPTAAPANTASSSPAESRPSASPTTSASAIKPLQSLCESIPAETMNASLGGNASCSVTDRDNQSMTIFEPFDLAHAEWGGPEGQANEIIVTIKPSFMAQYGGDQFKIAQEVSDNPQDITVLGYPGVYIPEQDITVNNGAQVQTEIEVIKAGPYLVSLITEQLSGSAPAQAETTQLAEAIIQHALPQS